MKRQDFFYRLPPELIASEPPPQRRDSRLLGLNGETGELTHGRFPDMLDWVQPGDLMVFNDTRVIPARLAGRKASGGKVEILVERVLDECHALAQVRASKAPKEGGVLVLEDGTEITVTGRAGEFFRLAFPAGEPVTVVLERLGQTPLPPYIERAASRLDAERYQTVYARERGAVAAPTAGLHFDEALLDQLRAKGVALGFVTLHVGAGTFQPMRAENPAEHRMHSEVMTVSETVCAQVRAAKSRGGRVIAVGTTSVRCLETASRGGEIEPFQGETDIFIYPPYEFKVVDGLITNFHLPESTLIMLVAAFAGHAHTMAAYRQAVAQRYRFFSYGDAMFISRKQRARNGNHGTGNRKAE